MRSRNEVDHDQTKTFLYGAAVVLRLLLVVTFPALPPLLTGRVEISNPVNSFKRLQEGLFLYERGLDPYDGGVFHQAPLLLPIFSLLPNYSTATGQIASVLLYSVIDILTADALYEIALSGVATGSRHFTSPRCDRSWSPVSVAAIYLFNPFNLLACLGRPTTLFATLFTFLSIKYAVQSRWTTSAFALAISSYISLHPVLLLPPIELLCYDRLYQQIIDENAPQDRRRAKASSKVAVDQRTLSRAVPFAVMMAAVFFATFAFLIGLSRLLLPSWNFIPSVYLTRLSLPDLTPNPGLWWYFFTEMFDAFREFFLGVFWLHMLSYSVPLCLRFSKQPLAAVVLMMGINAVFQPYPSIGDVGSWLSGLCLLGHVLDLSSKHRYTFPALAALLYASLLGPAFHHLWIYAGSGNANFFYAITLVWNLALLILLTDVVYALLRDEWEEERPEGKDKEVRQT